MALQPLPAEPFELALEVVGRGEDLVGRLELSLLRLEPLAPEGLERVEMRLRLAAQLGVGGRQRRVGGLAEHVDVRHALLLRGFESREKLVDRSREIGPPVRHMGEVAGKFGPDPGPEDRDDDVERGGLRNLRLKGAVGLVDAVFPEDWLERDEPLVFPVELGGDRIDAPPLRRDIPRRGDEDANLARLVAHDDPPKQYNC